MTGIILNVNDASSRAKGEQDMTARNWTIAATTAVLSSPVCKLVPGHAPLPRFATPMCDARKQASVARGSRNVVKKHYSFFGVADAEATGHPPRLAGEAEPGGDGMGRFSNVASSNPASHRTGSFVHCGFGSDPLLATTCRRNQGAGRTVLGPPGISRFARVDEQVQTLFSSELWMVLAAPEARGTEAPSRWPPAWLPDNAAGFII
ncbi:hypothetical protein [Rhizobium leguminosarum]|uniref:hypothetical protein n=1 Tax=Rhizobium leguminosarum TaxID=384 RepID=UPI001249F561|nr:hypothetical protein [Rhizobium leguminosarum]